MPYKDPEKQREYQRVWAAEKTSTEKKRAWRTAARERNRAIVRLAKDVPCCDCGTDAAKRSLKKKGIDV